MGIVPIYSTRTPVYPKDVNSRIMNTDIGHYTRFESKRRSNRSKNVKIEENESNETSETISNFKKKKHQKKKKKIREQDKETTNKPNYSVNQLIFPEKVIKHLMMIDIGHFSRYNQV
jgi:hypothetical protein